MSLARWFFLAMFTLAFAVIMAFTVAVLREAFRSGGAVTVSPRLLARMARGRVERDEAHRWAFLLHRTSGFAVFAFLCIHVIDIAFYAVSPELYDDLHGLYGTVPVRVFECGLLLALLFHGLNGLRIVVVDVADLSAAAALRGLQVVAVLTVALGLAGSVVIMRPVFV